MTARYRARAKIRVTLTLMPSLVTCVIAVRPSGGGRDLHEHVVAVHCGPQGAGHVRGGGGVTGQSGVDLDEDPPVCPGGLPVHRGQDVTGGADVNCCRCRHPQTLGAITCCLLRRGVRLARRHCPSWVALVWRADRSARPSPGLRSAPGPSCEPVC